MEYSNNNNNNNNKKATAATGNVPSSREHDAAAVDILEELAHDLSTQVGLCAIKAVLAMKERCCQNNDNDVFSGFLQKVTETCRAVELTAADASALERLALSSSSAPPQQPARARPSRTFAAAAVFRTNHMQGNDKENSHCTSDIFQNDSDDSAILPKDDNDDKKDDEEDSLLDEKQNNQRGSGEDDDDDKSLGNKQEKPPPHGRDVSTSCSSSTSEEEEHDAAAAETTTTAPPPKNDNNGDESPPAPRQVEGRIQLRPSKRREQEESWPHDDQVSSDSRLYDTTQEPRRLILRVHCYDSHSH